jgi:adenosylhomocysteine nucleosidase
LSGECKVAIVAAMELEVRPFIKGWSSTEDEFDGRRFKFFENAGTVLVCGGIGAEAARRAAKAVISLYRPALIVSAGFAGALEPGLEVGHTLILRHVIDAADGSRTDTGVGEGVLLTSADVADADQTTRFGEAYGAQAVDMEAAAVARSAEADGVKFMACKVISDTSGSSLPPAARFVDSNGTFHVIKFLAYIAVRPWLWLKVQRLAKDSAIAAGKLCEVLSGASMASLVNKQTMVTR